MCFPVGTLICDPSYVRHPSLRDGWLSTSPDLRESHYAVCLVRDGSRIRRVDTGEVKNKDHFFYYIFPKCW